MASWGEESDRASPTSFTEPSAHYKTAATSPSAPISPGSAGLGSASVLGQDLELVQWHPAPVILCKKAASYLG